MVMPLHNFFSNTPVGGTLTNGSVHRFDSDPIDTLLPPAAEHGSLA